MGRQIRLDSRLLPKPDIQYIELGESVRGVSEMEHLLPAVVQAIIAGFFGLIAVYLGHWLKSRRVHMIASATEIANNADKSTNISSATGRAAQIFFSPIRQILDVIAAIILANIVVWTYNSNFSIAGTAFIAFFVFFCACYFLFKEPRWMPVLIAIFILSLPAFHRAGTGLILVSSIAVSTVILAMVVSYIFRR